MWGVGVYIPKNPSVGEGIWIFSVTTMSFSISIAILILNYCFKFFSFILFLAGS